MKKILLTIALASLAALATQAQGFVIFGSGTQNVSTNGVTTGRTAGAGNFYYALFYSTTQTTINGSALGAQGTAAETLLNGAAGWTFSGDYASTTATAGRWTSIGANADGTSTVAGLAGGASAQFAILGWSANLGTTLSAVQSALAALTPGTIAYLGQSIVSGTLQAGDGALVTPATISSGGAPGIQGFTLGAVTAVPEPGTLALAALGGASLLAFRRKK